MSFRDKEKRKMQRQIEPVLTKKTSQINRSKIFAILRQQLFVKDPELTNRKLAAFLDVAPQHCSLFATGNDRQAPWWAILKLAHLLNKEIVLSPHGVDIRNKKLGKK